MGDDVWVSADSGDARVESGLRAGVGRSLACVGGQPRQHGGIGIALAMLKDEIERVDALGTAGETVAEAKAALRAATEKVDATQRGATEVGRSARDYPIAPAVLCAAQALDS